MLARMPEPDAVQEALRQLALDTAQYANKLANEGNGPGARNYVEMAYIAASAAGLGVGPPLPRGK
jgi:hypothetical protein